MKFQVTFKSPDGVSDSINEAAQKILFDGKDEEWLEAFYNLTPLQRRDALDPIREELSEFISKWVSGGEYITIDFNSDMNTAMVIPKIR